MPHSLSHLTGLAFLISEEVLLPTDLAILIKEKKNERTWWLMPVI